eukprot:jgi/Psemu1/12033/gm1.12033_g
MDVARNTATRHFEKPEPESQQQSMPSPEPIHTPVFCAAQLHGTYWSFSWIYSNVRQGCARSLSVCNSKKEETKKKTCNESHQKTLHCSIERYGDEKQQT